MGFGAVTKKVPESEVQDRDVQTDHFSIQPGGITKKSVSNNSWSQKLAVLPNHSIEVDRDGNLLISRSGGFVCKIASDSALWGGLQEIDYGAVRLAQYLDDAEFGVEKGENGLAAIDYAKVATRWFKRALREQGDRELRSEYNKYRHGKAGEVDRPHEGDESKNKGANTASIQVISFLMSEFTSQITAYSLDNAEEIATVLADIRDAVDQGYENESPQTRGRILIEALNFALSALRDDMRERNHARLILPEKVDVAYVPRKSGKASDFLQEHYGAFIEAGVCFRPDVKRLDPKLEMALSNEFRGRTDELRAILPTKADEVDARIESELGSPIRPENRRAARAAASYARQAKR
jgi:hypothetical protein